MKVTVEQGRGMLPVFYREPDGKQFVHFVSESNFPTTFEIPDGSKILTLNDLGPKKQENANG